MLCFIELTDMNHVTSVRNRKHALRMVQELDAFPKVPESYQETTATGGGSMLLTNVNLNTFNDCVCSQFGTDAHMYWCMYLPV